jgi:hypothetical protein
MWQGVWDASTVEEAHNVAHRGPLPCLSPLREGILPKGPFDPAFDDPQRGTAPQMHTLPEDVHIQIWSVLLSLHPSILPFIISPNIPLLDLNRHLKIHWDRSWICAGCSKCFQREEELAEHVIKCNSNNKGRRKTASNGGNEFEQDAEHMNKNGTRKR